jgi:hypothetical protein
MLKLENIDKLVGSQWNNWICSGAFPLPNGLGHGYELDFKNHSIQGAVIFHLYNKEHSPGRYTMTAEAWVTYGVSSGNKIAGDVLRPAKSNLLSKDDFMAFIQPILFRFENDIRLHNAKSYNTASIVARRINGGQSSFGGHQIPKPPPISAPSWYVPKEEVKPPTMWETFKEMVKWDKWINILFPMKTAIEQVIPKKKKITAKKAAY